MVSLIENEIHLRGSFDFRSWKASLNYQRIENVLTAKASRYPGATCIVYKK